MVRSDYVTIAHILQYDELNENKLYIPNSILKDLQNELSNASQIGFAYSYYYLVTYLYRYAKYGNANKFTQRDLKQLLGYNPDNKKVDFIIKKKGLLEQMFYVQTEKHYPVAWRMSETELLFILSNDDMVSDMIPNERNYTIKKPLRAFYSCPESQEDNYYDGTFYNTDNTHAIPVHVFITAMNTKKIGVIGFYLYGYFKRQNDISKKFSGQSFYASRERLAEDTGISYNVAIKYAHALADAGLLIVKTDHWKAEGGRKANVYSIKE